MHQDEIKSLFDQQAAHYDNQWKKTAPIRDCLHLLLSSLFSKLPVDASVLCVGVGTGDELLYLASSFQGWTFTLVEPSGAMLDICRQRASQAGITSRCTYHEGYLSTLPDTALHDAATCFLVSQFILDIKKRAEFFSDIAVRLKPNAVLASADLASDVESLDYEVLLHAWMSMMAAAEINPESIEKMRNSYAKDVGILAPEKIKFIIQSGGFTFPVQFFQSGLIHAWVSTRK